MKHLVKTIANPGIGRYFFAYFTISLFITLIIVFLIQWSAIRWFVYKYETETILNSLSKIKQNVNEIEKEHSERLSLLVSTYATNQNSENLDNLINDELASSAMFLVLNKQNDLIYGYEWMEFNNYIKTLERIPANFLFSDNYSIYQVSADTRFSYQSLETNTYIYITAYNQPSNVYINFRTISFALLDFSSEKILLTIRDFILNQNFRREFLIIPIDKSFACGAYVQFGMSGEEMVVHLIEYPREIFIFLRNIFFLIIFILLASVVVMTIVSFTVISNKIFNPLWNLIDKMKTISVEPKEISLVHKTIKGEILQIGESFNEMVLSIREYQLELSKSKELFQKIPIGIFWLDENENLKLYNNSFKAIFDIKEYEEINIKSLIPYDSKDYQWQGKKLEINPFYSEKLKKELSITIHIHSFNSHVEYYGIVTDVTEEIKRAKTNRTLELELIRINRLGEIGRRVQSIVHNLNSPLNSVIGFAQLIQDENPENEDINRIIKITASMSETIKFLLQKTADDSIAVPMAMNINKLIKRELIFCTHDIFYKHNINLTLKLGKKLPEMNLVYGDIAQVFQTIFNNAIDSMYETIEKNLTVSSFIKDDFVCISIQDTGVGMKRSVHEKIFEPCFSTKALTSSGGFGLGLSLAKSIIDKVNGKIDVKTEFGKGSEFIVYLPINS